MSQAFQSRLALAVKRHAYTQARLARVTKIKPAMLSHLLKGIRAPSVDTLTRLVIALPKTDARWLLTGQYATIEDDVSGHCESCGAEIIEGEDYNRDSEGVMWHKRCPAKATTKNTAGYNWNWL